MPLPPLPADASPEQAEAKTPLSPAPTDASPEKTAARTPVVLRAPADASTAHCADGSAPCGYPCSFVRAAWQPLEELPSLPEGALRLRRKLSKAIYGNVYLSNLADPDTPSDWVAVKRMPRACVLSPPDRVESASNELHAAHAIQMLEAPYVVKIVGVAQDYNFFYLVAEFCERGDLFTWLLRKGPVRQEPLLREILWQLLVAVRSLHREGIVHRDISLENILIHRDGSLRLCDFGQAVLVHAPGRCAEEVAVPHSELGPPGKPEYRAPETRASGAPYLAKAADAYSCGVVLLALATGMYPSDAAWLAAAEDPARQDLPHGTLLDLYLEGASSLGPGLRAMLGALLEPEPWARATVEEALRHPWLLEGSPRAGSNGGLGGDGHDAADVVCKDEDVEDELGVCSDGTDSLGDRMET